MNYVVVEPDKLEGQQIDYRYAERLPDGRVILPPSTLRVLSDIEILLVSEPALKKLIKEQQESGLYDKPTTLPSYPDREPHPTPLPGEVEHEEEWVEIKDTETNQKGE